MLKPSKPGLDFIAEFEGFSSKPYLCPAGKWTIGYGHTSGVTEHSIPVTEERAKFILMADALDYGSRLQCFIRVPLTQYQYDALLSWAYNVGTGAAYHSTLVRKLNAGDYEGAAKEFSRWVYGGGIKLQGLVRRRKREALLFREGKYKDG